MSPTSTLPEVKKDQPINKPTYAPLDINIARHSIFAPSDHRGFRKLAPWVDIEDGVRVVREVHVGTFEDTGKTLNPSDRKVLLAAALSWARRGMDMEDRRVCGSFTQTLMQLANGKKIKFSAVQINAVKESMAKLSAIPITYINSYESERGWETKTIQLFETVHIFHRKESVEAGGKYFEETELVINEHFCANVKAGKIKLFNLEQIFALRGEIPDLIISRLELYLSQIYPNPFRKDVLEFATEVGIKYKVGRERDVVRRFKKWCEVIRGQVLSDGHVANCHIEKSLGKSGFNFVASWGKPAPVLATKTKKTNGGVVHRPVLKAEQIKHIEDANREKELIELFEKMTADEKASIELNTKTIHQKKYGGMGTSWFAKIDAIREHTHAKALLRNVQMLAFRERPQIKYLAKPERDAFRSLADQLRLIIEMRQAIEAIKNDAKNA